MIMLFLCVGVCHSVIYRCLYRYVHVGLGGTNCICKYLSLEWLFVQLLVAKIDV